jgi:hypothetical protein
VNWSTRGGGTTENGFMLFLVGKHHGNHRSSVCVAPNWAASYWAMTPIRGAVMAMARGPSGKLVAGCCFIENRLDMANVMMRWFNVVMKCLVWLISRMVMHRLVEESCLKIFPR